MPALPSIDGFELLFGRDGSLTAMQGGGWLRGCSVPRAAAVAQLRSMSVAGQCCCLLDPLHAATVESALKRLGPEQAMITVVPNSTHAALLLHCGDLSAEISSGRLWLVIGEHWQKQLHELLRRVEGLAIPLMFVRTTGTDPQATDALIIMAQQTFSAVVSERRQLLDALVASPRTRATRAERFCIVGGKSFRLWNDAGTTLAAAVAGSEPDHILFDTDSPMSASHLAMARAATKCDAIVAADLFRADAPQATPPDLPWISWVTRRSVPSFPDSRSPDALLLADESMMPAAITAGWPATRLAVAGWPMMTTTNEPAGSLTLIADVSPLEPPPDLEHLSSHRLLWEHLAVRVAKDPFTAHGRPGELVGESVHLLQIDPASINTARFIEHLVIPAYTVAVARLLQRHGIAFEIWGEGWQGFPDLARQYHGPIRSRVELSAVVSAARAIVHAWPTQHAHPADATGRRILRYEGGGESAFIQAARRGQFRPPAQAAVTVSPATIRRLLGK